MSYEVENIGGVDPGLLVRILDAAMPPSGHVLALVGEADLDGEYAGICVPRFVLPESRTPAFIRLQDRDWDCGIAVSLRTCGLSRTHPAFFAQLLAHELGHAWVAAADPALHIYCAFLDRSIRKASNDTIRMWHELPHEQAHDAFGILIAERVLGRTQLEHDLRLLVASPDRDDHERLRQCQTLSPTGDYSGLRVRVVEFARPYESALCDLWRADKMSAKSAGGTSITDLAPDIEELFR